MYDQKLPKAEFKVEFKFKKQDVNRYLALDVPIVITVIPTSQSSELVPPPAKFKVKRSPDQNLYAVIEEEPDSVSVMLLTAAEIKEKYDIEVV